MEEGIIEPGKEVEMEMDEEELQLDEYGMRTAAIEDNDDERKNVMIWIRNLQEGSQGCSSN